MEMKYAVKKVTKITALVYKTRCKERKGYNFYLVRMFEDQLPYVMEWKNEIRNEKWSCNHVEAFNYV